MATAYDGILEKLSHENPSRHTVNATAELAFHSHKIIVHYSKDPRLNPTSLGEL